MVTVASSTKIPTARAKPPRVMMLMVSPIACNTRIDEKIDRGMEMAIMVVIRQLPKNNKSIKAVKSAAIKASWITPFTAALTKIDWSLKKLVSIPLGAKAITVGNFSLIPATTSKVDAPPFLSTESNTPREPFWWTILVWGLNPSRTWATSRKKVVTPLLVLIGIAFSPSIELGEPFRATVYSVSPIFAVPDGKIKFCAFTALIMSVEERPLAKRVLGSKSTETTLIFPPYG